MKLSLQFKAAILAGAIVNGAPVMAGEHGHQGHQGHQGHHGHKSHHGHSQDPVSHMEMMKAKFNLTDGQVSQFKAIMEETHGKVMTLQADAHKQMKALLNDEQQKKFEEHHKKRMGKDMGMKKAHGHGHGHGHGHMKH